MINKRKENTAMNYQENFFTEFLLEYLHKIWAAICKELV